MDGLISTLHIDYLYYKFGSGSAGCKGNAKYRKKEQMELLL